MQSNNQSSLFTKNSSLYNEILSDENLETLPLTKQKPALRNSGFLDTFVSNKNWWILTGYFLPNWVPVAHRNLEAFRLNSSRSSSAASNSKLGYLFPNAIALWNFGLPLFILNSGSRSSCGFLFPCIRPLWKGNLFLPRISTVNCCCCCLVLSSFIKSSAVSPNRLPKSNPEFK